MTPTANTRATYGPATAIGRSIFMAAEASGDGILLMLRALRYLPGSSVRATAQGAVHIVGISIEVSV